MPIDDIIIVSSHSPTFSTSAEPTIYDLVVGYYQLSGFFILRPHCSPLAMKDSRGNINPFGIMPYDWLWDVIEKWCNKETRWPKARVDRKNNKVFFHRKSDAVRFKLRFG